MRTKAAEIVPVGLCVFLATLVSGFAQTATDGLPSAGQPKNQVIATIPVGAGPRPVVVNPISTLVYVVNEGSNSVSVIDATTNTVDVVIPVSAGPSYAVAINPAGTNVYVENSNNNDGNTSLSVIYTPTNTVVKTIDIASGNPTGLEQLAMSPDGSKLYVGTGIPGEGVSVVDTATNEVSGTIKLDPPSGWDDEGSSGVVFNSSGRSGYVTFFAHRASGSGGHRLFVSKIDAAIGKQVSRSGPIVATGSDAEASIYGPRLYISNEVTVQVYDTKTKKVVKTVGVPGYTGGTAVTPDGKYLYVSYYQSGVSTFDTKTFELVGSPIQVGQNPSGIAIAPDGLRSYVANTADRTVSVIDISPQ